MPRCLTINVQTSLQWSLPKCIDFRLLRVFLACYVAQVFSDQLLEEAHHACLSHGDPPGPALQLASSLICSA